MDPLPLSTAQVDVPGETKVKLVNKRTVVWDGQTYSAGEGGRLLMTVIMDPATEASRRARALDVFGKLRDKSATPQLLSLYKELSDRDGKAEIILCLTWSEDPRGLPLFAQVMEHEEDDLVRLFAAIALAKWNVRRGVAELVLLLESETTLLRDTRTPRIRDNALAMFMNYNRRKGWGFSDRRFREDTASSADLHNEQRWALAIAEITKWFEANEHRFPEWKPGDPLPVIPEPKTDNSDE